MMSLLTPDTLLEKHTLNPEGNVVGFAAGRNVVLQVGGEDELQKRERDSAHANSHMLAEYKWDHKTSYEGRILSTGPRFLAYRLFNESTGQAIRVMERETRTRHLIKDFQAAPIDLLWASHAPLLAVLDSKANVYVYQMDENSYALTKYLNIIRNEEEGGASAARLVWCPYVGDEEKEDESPPPLHLLAVVYEKRADLYFLNAIKDSTGQSEVDAGSLETIEGAMISIETEAAITALRISPDATAFAITCMDGNLIFYIHEMGAVRKTHTMKLLPNSYVEDMLFMDNIKQRARNTVRDPFWKHVVIVSDNGRRLAIHDCNSWECIAKLRIESSQTARLDVQIDQTARYVYLVDYETSNLFCVELAPDFPDTQPYFVACAQISFSTPLICLSACSIQERTLEQDDFLLDDEDSSAREKIVEIDFVAITQRSLNQVRVDLQRGLDIDLNVEPESGARLMREKLTQQTRQLKLSNVSATSNQRLTTSSLGGSNSDLLEASSSLPRPHQQQPHHAHSKEKIYSPDPPVTASNKQHRRSHQHGEYPLQTPSHHDNGAETAQLIHVMMGEMKKLQQVVADLSEGCKRQEKRNEELNAQLEKLNKAHTDLRRENTDNLADVLEKISNEIANRDEHVEAVIARMNDTLRKDVKKIVEASLNDNAVSLQATMELTNTRVVDTVKSVLTQILVPSVDQICTQLFHQLNENFRDGLQEFMDQVRAELDAQQQAAATSPPDYVVKTQAIDNGLLTFFTQLKPGQPKQPKGRASIDSVKK